MKIQCVCYAHGTSQCRPATFQVFRGHTWHVATILDSVTLKSDYFMTHPPFSLGLSWFSHCPNVKASRVWSSVLHHLPPHSILLFEDLIHNHNTSSPWKGHYPSASSPFSPGCAWYFKFSLSQSKSICVKLASLLSSMHLSFSWLLMLPLML